MRSVEGEKNEKSDTLSPASTKLVEIAVEVGRTKGGDELERWTGREKEGNNLETCYRRSK